RHRLDLLGVVHPGQPRGRPALQRDRSADPICVTRSRERAMLRRFCRNRGAVAGVIVLCLFAVVALAAPLATTYDPEQARLEQKLLEPTPAHLLGTDHLGRDILARLAYGGRFSLFIGFAAVGLALLIGVPLGTICGFYGGWLDLIIQRVIDVFLSFPDRKSV